MKPRLTLTAVIIGMLLLTAWFGCAVAESDFVKSSNKVHDSRCDSSGTLNPSGLIDPDSASFMSDDSGREKFAHDPPIESAGVALERVKRSLSIDEIGLCRVLERFASVKKSECETVSSLRKIQCGSLQANHCRIQV